MTPLWFIAPAILIVGLPFVIATLARLIRDARSIQRSASDLSVDLRSTAAELSTTTRGFVVAARTFEVPDLRRSIPGRTD